MRVLYFDCFSGISGDMTLAALVDAGADREYIESELKAKIQIEPFELSWKRVTKCGISAIKLDVELDPSRPPTHHRHYSEIAAMIDNAGFNERVSAFSHAIFLKIGAAEAKIHNIPLEKVHFHEVGAIDSIVDVIGVALAIDSLNVDRILCSSVPLGSGTVRCDHGLYPVPAPATLEMMKGLPVAQSSVHKELTTPTGAGIVSGVVDEFIASFPSLTVEEIGYGAGTRDLPNQPNVLRVVIGTTHSLAEAVVHATKPHHHHHETEVPHHHHEHGHSHHEHEHEHEHTHDHEHEHEHTHTHGHDHSHDQHSHEHEHAHHHDEDSHKHSTPKH